MFSGWSLVRFAHVLSARLALIYHRGVVIGALTVGSYGQILTAKIVLALVSFALAAVHGVTGRRASARIFRMVGIAGGAMSAMVVLLATALVP